MISPCPLRCRSKRRRPLRCQSKPTPRKRRYPGRGVRRRKEEKKNKKEQQTYPLFPRPALLSSQALVTSCPAYCCTLRKKEDLPVRRACASVLSCVTVVACSFPVLLCFAPSRLGLIHLPSPSRQDPVDGEKLREKEQQKHNNQPDPNFHHPKPRPCFQE